MPKRILVATEKPFAPAARDQLVAVLEKAGYGIDVLEKYTDRSDLLNAVRNVHAIIVRSDKIDSEVMDAAQDLKLVVRAGAGYDNIECEEAKKRGIVVANVPTYCIEEVSDTAVAHILNCVRKVSVANELLHKGEWEYPKIKPIYRFSDATVGLIAFGNIAKRVAEKLRPIMSRYWHLIPM